MLVLSKEKCQASRFEGSPCSFTFRPKFMALDLRPVPGAMIWPSPKKQGTDKFSELHNKQVYICGSKLLSLTQNVCVA